mmetsp:Transcript_12706/g.15346  ORF Transcript_12706/g.15346 Transcript_12706/m.15346 type:complete len:342 (-) Transcript_12706:1367-2392(-)
MLVRRFPRWAARREAPRNRCHGNSRQGGIPSDERPDGYLVCDRGDPARVLLWSPDDTSKLRGRLHQVHGVQLRRGLHLQEDAMPPCQESCRELHGHVQPPRPAEGAGAAHILGYYRLHVRRGAGSDLEDRAASFAPGCPQGQEWHPHQVHGGVLGRPRDDWPDELRGGRSALCHRRMPLRLQHGREVPPDDPYESGTPCRRQLRQELHGNHRDEPPARREEQPGLDHARPAENGLCRRRGAATAAVHGHESLRSRWPSRSSEKLRRSNGYGCRVRRLVLGSGDADAPRDAVPVEGVAHPSMRQQTCCVLGQGMHDPGESQLQRTRDGGVHRRRAGPCSNRG